MAFTFTGPIVPGDFERLGAFIQAAPSNVQLKAIFLDSGGGNLGEASRIAELFSKTQPFVVVMSGSQCTSACFLLFAAAGQRAVAPDGLIGVHSASEDNGQEDLNSMAATTLFARDAAAYGVPPSIIGKLVQTGPDRVTWLDPSDLASMHVQIIDVNAPAPVDSRPTTDSNATPHGLTESPAPQTAAAASWIQIYSRALFSEAVAIGSDYRHRFANARVFKSNNGWYMIALGPYEPAAAVEVRDRLVNSGDIPGDSLVTESVTFQQMVWGNDDTTASTPPSFSSSVALEAATAFFRTWTLSNREALSFLDRVYPAQLLYFGKRSSKAYVMADKQAFVERWPQRAYSMRPGTVSTSCDPKDNSCTVSGVIDWRASSSERNAMSTGSARFQLTFSNQGNQPTLLSEWTEVLTRHAGP